jgi:hypothetical protein
MIAHFTLFGHENRDSSPELMQMGRPGEAQQAPITRLSEGLLVSNRRNSMKAALNPDAGSHADEYASLD